MKEYRYKFSVIIPVYNVEDYLEETIESVLVQSIGFEENIQLILVNDGSPDNSGEICEKYQKLYPNNVKYIIKENGGVSSARNAGIKHIEGKYVNFLDSDDKWGSEAFKIAYDFFEEHYNEVDVVCARMRFFEARHDWHALDYKFRGENRVADLLSEEECSSIHLHVSSTFIKSEAITESDRFCEQIKYGEDSLFLNLIILKKAKLGINRDCIFFYRKRANRSSATQVQKVDLAFYTTSPRLYYGGLVEKSLSLYGRVIEYVQHIIAYDWGWRVDKPLPESIRDDELLCSNYVQFLKEMIGLVNEDIILKNRIHRRIEIKSALMELRNNSNLLEETHFDSEEGTIFYKDIPILLLKGKNGICQVNVCEIKDKNLILEGIVSRWIFKCFPKDDIKIGVKIGKKKYDLNLIDISFAKWQNIFGEEDRNYTFQMQIPLKKHFAKKNKLKIKFYLSLNGVPHDLSHRYGKFVPNTTHFKSSYRVFGKYFMKCYRKLIVVWMPKNAKIERFKCELEAQRWLRSNKLGKYANLRIKLLLMQKYKFKGKKLWIISDRFEKAGDNGEAFFRYMCTRSDTSDSILPVFAISKYSPDVDKLKAIGEVIFFEDELYPLYFLCADKHINSSGVDFACNAVKGEMRKYLYDLKKGHNVFLQHGITCNDLSSWLNKFNKKIDLFITAAEKERNSIINGNYLYNENQVALTGFARYDLLENAVEKKIVIIPTWRASIKDSYTADSQSVYFDGFKDTEYFKFYNSLINDERLLTAMRRAGYVGSFCLHPMHMQQSIDFRGNDVFEIKDGFVDYKQIFSTSALLVTDYSSVFFDFAYLHKPVVYCQFDAESFYSGQVYNKGYFEHETDGFGPVCYDLDTAVEAILSIIENDCLCNEMYDKRIRKFYKYTDRNNCERIYNAILEI